MLHAEKVLWRTANLGPNNSSLFKAQQLPGSPGAGSSLKFRALSPGAPGAGCGGGNRPDPGPKEEPDGEMCSLRLLF